jgi:long-chain acyl-CoA synthetase
MLSDLLVRHAAERPDRPALISSTRMLTYAELSGEVERMAAGFAARGVEPGDAVGLLLPNCPEFVIGFLAIARLGAVAVPLSIDLKDEEARPALEAAGCRTLLADGRFEPLCRNLLRDGALLRAFPRGGDDPEMPTLDRLTAETEKYIPLPLPPEDAVLLQQFTSGTTGQPKRIVRTHAHLLHEATAFEATVGIAPEDRILAVVPLSHAHGLGNALLAALRAGAALVLQERFDRRETLRLLSRERITLFPAVPFMLSILADTRMPEPIDLSALRLCFTAGAPLRRETWRKVRDRLGISLRQLYGSTETGALTINLDEDPEAAAESVGRPLEGVRVAVLDEAGVPLPPEVEGEVAVRSPAAAEWYIGPQGKTPLPGSDGWIRTGDLGRLDPDGRLYLTGRQGLLINVAGRKVNPAELESLLMSHPKVREAVVVGLRDPYGEEAVKAVIVQRKDCAPEEILAYCRERLADYKVPRIVEFRDAIPRCPAGKILRKHLLEETPCAS